MYPPSRPFDDIRALIGKLPEADAAALAAVARDAQLTKPAGALGRLEEIAEWLAAWQGAARRISMRRSSRFSPATMAWSRRAFRRSPSVTQTMVANFTRGGAAINQICKTFDISLKVFELALDQPTGDITHEAALTNAIAPRPWLSAWRRWPRSPIVLCLGEMGIGNTTVAAAIYHALYGGKAEDWVGRGTGVDDAGLEAQGRRRARGCRAHREYLGDPLEILRRLGGREIAAMAGAILAARIQRVPVCSTASSSAPRRRCCTRSTRSALDHCLAGHVSAERPTPKLCAASARRRCSISACAWAKAPAPRWRSAS